MRIRMVEPRASVDGVDLSVFQGGRVYEVDPSIATYLVVSGVAEPCAGNSPALVIRTDEVMVGVFLGARPVADVACDREEEPEP
jgi:hypothetical protein